MIYVRYEQSVLEIPNTFKPEYTDHILNSSWFGHACTRYSMEGCLWFVCWRGACFVPSHYPSKCWHVVNWKVGNKNNVKEHFSFEKMHLKLSAKWFSFGPDFSVLNIKNMSVTIPDRSRHTGILTLFNAVSMRTFKTCNARSNIIGDRANSRFAPCQWETSLQSNAVSHCLGTNLESALVVTTVAAWLPFRFREGTRRVLQGPVLLKLTSFN